MRTSNSTLSIRTPFALRPQAMACKVYWKAILQEKSHCTLSMLEASRFWVDVLFVRFPICQWCRGKLSQLWMFPNYDRLAIFDVCSHVVAPLYTQPMQGRLLSEMAPPPVPPPLDAAWALDDLSHNTHWCFDDTLTILWSPFLCWKSTSSAFGCRAGTAPRLWGRTATRT